MDRKKLRDESEEFAATNLRECAEELLEWNDTALLRDGKVRELARLCAVWAGDRDALTIAKHIVEQAALRDAVTPNVEVRGASRLYGEASSGEAATSTAGLEGAAITEKGDRDGTEL